MNLVCWAHECVAVLVVVVVWHRDCDAVVVAADSWSDSRFLVVANYCYPHQPEQAREQFEKDFVDYESHPMRRCCCFVPMYCTSN